MILLCDICGVEFEAKNGYEKYCKDCRYQRPYKADMKEPEPIKATTKNIMEAVREAAKLGLSYGEYKGREK